MKLKNHPILIVIITFFNIIQIIAQTKVIAHRGFSGIAPENTWIAFQKAIDAGAEYIELDVHKSKDGELFVIHDNTVNRTSSNQKKGFISKMTSKEIQEVKVGYPKEFGDEFKNERIPTLKEVLKLAKGKIKVCIELKAYDIEEKVLKIVNALEMNDQVIIFSFYDFVLINVRKLDSTIPILYLKYKLEEEKNFNFAKSINAFAIGVGYGTKVTKELLDKAHEKGIEIWQSTVNDEKNMYHLINLGLDGLITNNPDSALEMVEELQKNTLDETSIIEKIEPLSNVP